MQWVLFAFRPLVLEELYSAVSTSIGSLDTAIQGHTHADYRAMRTFILASLRGLVEMTRDEPPTAQLIHESVREYLLHKGLVRMDPSLAGNVVPLCNAKLAH